MTGTPSAAAKFVEVLARPASTHTPSWSAVAEKEITEGLLSRAPLEEENMFSRIAGAPWRYIS